MFGVQRVLGIVSVRIFLAGWRAGGLAGSLPAARLSVVEPGMWAEKSKRYARDQRTDGKASDYKCRGSLLFYIETTCCFTYASSSWFRPHVWDDRPRGPTALLSLKVSHRLKLKLVNSWLVTKKIPIEESVWYRYKYKIGALTETKPETTDYGSAY